MPAIDFHGVWFKPTDLERIVVAEGPVVMGQVCELLATAKLWLIPSKIGLVGVSSYGRVPESIDGLVIPPMDWGRNNVYAGFYKM